MLALVTLVLLLSCTKTLLSEVRKILPNMFLTQLYFCCLHIYLLTAGLGIESENEFEAFIEYANRIEMDDSELVE